MYKMSTHGAIVVPAIDEYGHRSFKGRYHHCDSYPAGLGKTLYQLMNKVGYEETVQLLIHKHPAGWLSIVNADFSQEPGYMESEIGKENHPPLCYCHGERSEEPLLITPEEALRTFCDYIYLLKPEGFEILLVFGTPKRTTRRTQKRRERITWRTLADVALDKPEPNWNELESIAIKKYEAYET